MMRLIVFGATGGIGKAVLRLALAQEHQVTAFVRNPAALSPQAGLEIVKGDVMRATDVARAVSNHDTVIVTLGNSQNPFKRMLGLRRTTPPDVCEAGTSNVIAAMRAAGMTRLLVVSAFGIGVNRDRLKLMFKLFYRVVLREQMADKEKQEAVVRASGLDWTIVQPVGLTDGAATGTFLASTDGDTRKAQIPRADVAAFLLQAAGGGYGGQTVALSG